MPLDVQMKFPIHALCKIEVVRGLKRQEVIEKGLAEMTDRDLTLAKF